MKAKKHLCSICLEEFLRSELNRYDKGTYDILICNECLDKTKNNKQKNILKQ